MENNIAFTTPEWSDISRLYAYVLAETASGYDAKNKEERMEAKEIAEREISSVLLDSSFVAEYGCQKANIKSKTLADYSRAVLANNFEHTDSMSFLNVAKEEQSALLQETLERMSSLNRTLERYESYFSEVDEENKIRFSIYNSSDEPYVGKNKEVFEAGAYIPIDRLSKNDEGEYNLQGLDVTELEQEVKQNFVESYLEANLEKTVAKLEENVRTWEGYMRHNASMDKADNAQKAYTMNKLPRAIEDEGRRQFMEEHRFDAQNALVGRDRETGEKFPTTKIMSNQIRNYIEFCDDVSGELGFNMLGSEHSAIGKGMEQSRNKKWMKEMSELEMD